MGEHVRSRTLDESRDLNYPPLPEPLVVGVYDNHTHLEIADGLNPMGYREHLDKASSVGVRGVVQVGNDLETSRWSAEIAAISADQREVSRSLPTCTTPRTPTLEALSRCSR